MKRTWRLCPNAYGYVFGTVDDVYSDETNESSNEFYNGPEYTPYHEKQISGNEFEVSDTDDSLS